MFFRQNSAKLRGTPSKLVPSITTQILNNHLKIHSLSLCFSSCQTAKMTNVYKQQCMDEWAGNNPSSLKAIQVDSKIHKV